MQDPHDKPGERTSTAINHQMVLRCISSDAELPRTDSMLVVRVGGGIEVSSGTLTVSIGVGGESAAWKEGTDTFAAVVPGVPEESGFDLPFWPPTCCVPSANEWP